MSKKKLIVLSTSPHLYQGAGGRTRIVHELREIHAGEANVTLLCLVKLKHFLKPGRLRQARRQLAADAGTRVVYLPSLPSFHGKITGVVKALNVGLVRLYSTFFGCRNFHAQTISAAVVVTELKRRMPSVRLLTDAHGVGPEEHLYRSTGQGQAKFEALSKQEKHVLESSELVFLVSNRMRKHYVEKYGITLDNSLVVPCLTADNATTPADSSANADGRPEKIADIPADRLIFCYAGSYRKYQLVDETFALFATIKKRVPEAFFLILTNQKDVFDSTARERGLTATDYKIVSLPQGEVVRYLRAADFGFMLRDDSVVNKVASPTKFAEYLAAGLPVLTTDFVGDYSELVGTHRAGYTVHNLAEPEEELFEFIREYQEDKAAVRARALALAAGFTWKSQRSTIVETMRKYDFL